MLVSTESVVLRPEAQSAGEARRFTRRICEQADLDADVCDTAVLLTSETVTNAIVHGRSEVRLAVTAGTLGVRVEVGDDNCRRPTLRLPDSEALDGRGLALLGAIAAKWGVVDDLYGKVVWFEVHFHD